ncbi:hypothetical protein KAR91_03575 [Candidatus Pacearchaeota archaeon]|nr:hypothetical protein [Candidatus Pacearchaeota archaeon]
MTLEKNTSDIQYQKSNDWEKCIICGDTFSVETEYKDHLEHCIDYEDAFDFLDALRESGVTNMFGSGPYIEKEFGISRKLAGKVFMRWTETFESRHPISQEKLLVKVLSSLNEEQWKELEDGHELFKPEHYTKMGFPLDYAEKFVRNFKSDGTPKGTIFRDGKVVAELNGIYNLQFVQGLCRTLDISYASKMGRGFQARECVRALQEAVK